MTANNHSSPTGTLPFLLPASQVSNRPSTPIPASKIQKWASSQVGRDQPQSIRNEAYNTLLDRNIRDAWLYTVYLDDGNFNRVAVPWYVASTSSNIVVQSTTAILLQQAARAELQKYSMILDVEAIFARAEESFMALSEALHTEDTFSGIDSPGFLDAAVFSYSHLLLDDEVDWCNSRLSDTLRKYSNLVNHRERLLRKYFEI